MGDDGETAIEETAVELFLGRVGIFLSMINDDEKRRGDKRALWRLALALGGPRILNSFVDSFRSAYREQFGFEAEFFKNRPDSPFDIQPPAEDLEALQNMPRERTEALLRKAFESAHHVMNEDEMSRFVVSCLDALQRQD